MNRKNTGIKDRLGIDIMEFDIVKNFNTYIQGYHPNCKVVGEIELVVFDTWCNRVPKRWETIHIIFKRNNKNLPDKFFYVYKGNKINFMHGCLAGDIEYEYGVEVIGNIFDTPYLLPHSKLYGEYFAEEVTTVQ